MVIKVDKNKGLHSDRPKFFFYQTHLIVSNSFDSGIEVCSLDSKLKIFVRHDIKGKGTQKYKWILSKSIWKTAHFDANCLKIGFLVFKLLQFYVFKIATNGGRHFEMPLKLKIIKLIYFLKACINIHNL